MFFSTIFIVDGTPIIPKRVGVLYERMMGLELPAQKWLRLRRPEYTGSNRCLPCTALNLLLTGVIGALLGLRSSAAAVLFVLLALGSIAVRGYLIPGTPTLTKRYLPERVLAWFGKQPESVDGPAVDVIGSLTDAGVLETGGADLSLTPEFESALGNGVLALNSDRAVRTVTASFLDVDSEAITIDGHEPWTVRVDSTVVGRWESRSAFLTDLAADQLLAARATDWDGLDGATRGRILSAVRACLGCCPVCAGTVSLDTTVVETCCRDIEVVTTVCQDCGARLFEARTQELGLDS